MWLLSVFAVGIGLNIASHYLSRFLDHFSAKFFVDRRQRSAARVQARLTLIAELKGNPQRQLSYALDLLDTAFSFLVWQFMSLFGVGAATAAVVILRTTRYHQPLALACLAVVGLVMFFTFFRSIQLLDRAYTASSILKDSLSHDPKT